MQCIRCNGSGEEPKRVAPIQHDFKSAAKVIREAAKERREGAKDWPGEPDMKAMVIGDAKDMREVAKLLRAGNVEAAMDHAYGMDTAARDNIPQAAWDFMSENNGS